MDHKRLALGIALALLLLGGAPAQADEHEEPTTDPPDTSGTLIDDKSYTSIPPSGGTGELNRFRAKLDAFNNSLKAQPMKSRAQILLEQAELRGKLLAQIRKLLDNPDLILPVDTLYSVQVSTRLLDGKALVIPEFTVSRFSGLDISLQGFSGIFEGAGIRITQDVSPARRPLLEAVAVTRRMRGLNILIQAIQDSELPKEQKQELIGPILSEYSLGDKAIPESPDLITLAEKALKGPRIGVLGGYRLFESGKGVGNLGASVTQLIALGRTPGRLDQSARAGKKAPPALVLTGIVHGIFPDIDRVDSSALLGGGAVLALQNRMPVRETPKEPGPDGLYDRIARWRWRLGAAYISETRIDETWGWEAFLVYRPRIRQYDPRFQDRSPNLTELRVSYGRDTLDRNVWMFSVGKSF